MAAIAYVTDENMLDYYRVNGIGSVVFWRLSSKNFSDFKPGDLLFFLSKDTEARRSREKGIVGYGCYTGRSSLSIDTIWKKYGDKTGYSSKTALIEAIERNCKTAELPKKIDCLQLEKVMFFQNPIFLSELGYSISNKLESFTYLDRNEGQQTLQILREAQRVGLDLWSAAIGNGNEEIFGQQLMKYQISTVVEEMEIDSKIKNCEEVLKKYGNESSMWINHKKYAFMSFEPTKKLYYIFDAPAKAFKEEYYKSLGYLMGLKEFLMNTFEEKVELVFVSNAEMNEVQVKMIKEFCDDFIYNK